MAALSRKWPAKLVRDAKPAMRQLPALAVGSPVVSAAGLFCNAAPRFDNDLYLLEHVEDLAIEQFLAELRIKSLAIALLPGTAGHDVGGPGPDSCNPVARCPGNELRAVAPRKE